MKNLNFSRVNYLISMNKIKVFLLVILAVSSISRAQDDLNGIEIYIVDSFITQEPPYKFSLSFFTSDSCLSKVKIDNDKEYIVSNEKTDFHKIELDLNGLMGGSSMVNYKVLAIDDGKEFESQIYEVEIPKLLSMDKNRDLGFLQVCCFGGVIFGLPSPTYVTQNGNRYFSLTKEIPLFSFYSGGYNYPFGYIGAEYAHVFKSDKKNFLRVGYKQIFQLEFIKYVSVGANYFTDFRGYNGISPELAFGIIQLQNVFTLYTKYRYNFQPDRSGTDFHEISVGLYSNFFSINF